MELARKKIAVATKETINLVVRTKSKPSAAKPPNNKLAPALLQLTKEMTGLKKSKKSLNGDGGGADGTTTGGYGGNPKIRSASTVDSSISTRSPRSHDVTVRRTRRSSPSGTNASRPDTRRRRPPRIDRERKILLADMVMI